MEVTTKTVMTEDRMEDTTKTVMTEDHKATLKKHLPTLTSNLVLGGQFWALLIGFLVITCPEKQKIVGDGRSDDEQILELVAVLMRKPDDCFHKFVEALRQTDQPHLVVLLEEDQVPMSAPPKPLGATGSTAKETSDMTVRGLQETIMESLLRICSKVETWTWAADKEYVPISRLFTDLVWGKQRGYTALGRYTDMFEDEDGRPATFVFVQGLAGTGKSTLIQMLNMTWCTLVEKNRKIKRASLFKRLRLRWNRFFIKQDPLDYKEAKVFSRFTYVILITLRYVKTGQSLQEVIKEQYCLDDRTSAFLYDGLSRCPKETLFYLEGYDEYIESTSSDITDIAHRNTFRKSTVVITSRHSPSYHFPDVTDRAYKPDNHVLLRGFNPDGVCQYVNNFFHDTDVTQAVPLLQKIKESDQLTDLSRYPAILLLMCTLWAHEGSLSDSITGFFLKFVVYACGRYEAKFVRPSQRTMHDNIVEKYKSCLMKIGEISVDGLREDKLQLTFLFKDVIIKIGEIAWQLGFLKRESNIKGEELVAFPHKTMQEFFCAFYIANCDKERQNDLLMQFCSSVKALKESEMIQTFLAGLGGEQIQKEIEKIIGGSEKDRAKIIPALQLSYQAENMNAQLKLPPRVELEVTDRYREAVYRQYLSGDRSCLTHLTVKAEHCQSTTENAVLSSINNMSRLTELTFGIYSLSVSGLGTLSHILKSQNIQLTTLDLVGAVGEDVRGAPWPSLMASLPVTLETLSVAHNNITDESTRQLSLRVSRLTRLHVIVVVECKLSDARAVLEIIKNCQTLPQFYVWGNKLGDGLVNVINLTPNMAALRRLYLRANNLSDHVRDRISRQLSKDLPQLELWV